MNDDQNRLPADDLFPDDEQTAAPEGQRPGRARRLARISAFVVVLVAGGAFWYASVRNHDRYFLSIDDDVLTVERGLWFPVGRRDWQPSVAYAPLRLPADLRPTGTGPMSAGELDAALLRLFVDIAERELGDFERGDVGRAEDALVRAGKLPLVGPEDARRVQALIGDTHFRRGLAEVRDLQSRFDEALRHFDQAAAQGGERFRGAARWADAIRRQREAFRRLVLDSGLDPDKVLAAPPSAPPPPPSEGEEAPAE